MNNQNVLNENSINHPLSFRGVSVTLSGVVLSAIYIANFIFQPLFGKYLEKFGPKNFLILGCILLGLGNGIIGLMEYISDFSMFVSGSIAMRVLAAIGDSMATPASYALIAKQVSPENEGIEFFQEYPFKPTSSGGRLSNHTAEKPLATGAPF